MQYKADKIPQKWLDIILDIPGYDCRDEAGDCVFDTDAAELALGFFPEMLRHVKGKTAGQPFYLEPWESAIVANLCGWKRPDGTRRYRVCFLFVGKKNGKSSLMAGLIILVMCTDGEQGAEIYSAAASRDQAAIIFDHVAGMVREIPELVDRFTVYGNSVVPGSRSVIDSATSSFYKCLSADANTADGVNVHMAVIDELHRHKKPDLASVLERSTAARSQPLVIYTTTSDYERDSVCNTKLEYAENVRDGKAKDAEFLPVIYAATEADDWTAPATWAKANPNLGVTIGEEYFRRQVAICQSTPSELTEFKRLHLNIKTQAITRWLNAEHWAACAHGVTDYAAWRQYQLEYRRGRPCYAGLDLGSTDDTTACVLYFPGDDGETNAVIPWFWLPATGKWAKDETHRNLYHGWIEQGLIETTPGNMVDYGTVQDDLLALAERFEIRELAFDPWHAQQLSQQLRDEGLDTVEFRQGMASMNAPSKELERLIGSGGINHGGNPVLDWQAASVEVQTDHHNNIKPVKPSRESKLKMDGIVALVMAIGRATVAVDKGSVYATRGLLSV